MTRCHGSSPVPEEGRYCPSCGLFQQPLSQSPTVIASEAATRPTPLPYAPPVEPLDGGRFIPGALLAGRYRIVERVGRGGMGEVYRAEDLRLGQPVALKFLPPDLDRDPPRLERFFAEVRIARQVSHPSVCRVYDIGDADGLHFLSMEFVDGEDLASLLRRIGRLPAGKAVDIAREICAGLAAIHDRGVLHRDLKPGNVMIDGRGRARITDFGLAEFQGTTDDPDAIIGTPAYMPPEVLAGHPSTAHSDLYSLGLVLYELFTGKAAFEGTSLQELRARRTRPPVSPSALVRDLSPAVERVILRCLEREPHRRPASAMAVAAGLPGGDPLAAAIAAGETPSPEAVAAATGDGQGLRPVEAWTGLAALVVGLGLLVTAAPRTRVVPAVPLPESPAVMAARALDMIRGLGFEDGADRAHGFRYVADHVEHLAATDRSRTRWTRLGQPRPPTVLYWYRQSPREMAPSGRTHHVTYSDPPWLVPGMVGVELDGHGRMWRLDAVPHGLENPAAPGVPEPGPRPPDWKALFDAAGLDLARFRETVPRNLPPVYADHRAAWETIDPDAPGDTLRIEAGATRGRPVFFALINPWSRSPLVDAGTPNLAWQVAAWIRSAILVLAFLVGAWLARRNLRAGRGDRKRAFRMASGLMAARLLVWILGGHHTPGTLAEQFATALAWSLYDFAYVRIFYLAIEPYVRRLWPRVLVSWVRLLDGRLNDSLVGRDLLVGCLLGVSLNLGVALHQAAPVLLGMPPGRPDNVGFVEPTLAGLMNLPQLAAELLTRYRSAIVLGLGFVVILVLAKMILRRSWLAVSATFLLFVPLAWPNGEMAVLNLVFAGSSLGSLLFVLLRFGLFPAILGLMVNATLLSCVLTWNLSAWTGAGTVLVLLLLLGLGVYGFARSLAGRPALRDVL